MRKKNTRLSLILVSILVIMLSVLLCCCGVDTSNVAGSASPVYQSDQDADEDYDSYYEEDLEDEDLEDEELADEDAVDEPDEEIQDSEEPVMEYVLNTNTKKFHYPDCRSVKQMKDKNKLIKEATREEIINMGYDPCGKSSE